MNILLPHTIQIVKFLSKNSILTKPLLFYEFYTQFFFLTIFLVKSKLSTAKKSKTATFSRVFHLKKIKIEFLDKKNEAFEQCVPAHIFTTTESESQASCKSKLEA